MSKFCVAQISECSGVDSIRRQRIFGQEAPSALGKVVGVRGTIHRVLKACATSNVLRLAELLRTATHGAMHFSDLRHSSRGVAIVAEEYSYNLEPHYIVR